MQISAQHLAEIVDAARKAEKGSADKRRFIRQSVIARVEVLSHAMGSTYGALTRDISVEGIGLMQATPMARGDQFSISLPRVKASPLLAQCTVLHSREIADGVWGVGAAFVSAAPATKAQSNAMNKAEAHRIASKMLD